MHASSPAKAIVITTRRVGNVLISDPDDALLSYKLSFDDGKDPCVDWFSKHAVCVLEGSIDKGQIPEESLAASVVPRPGLFCHCRFVIRGTVKVTEAIVVEVGTCQIVVACPGCCALTAAGHWASSPELSACKTFHCACVEPGATCPLVFYSVDAAALVTRLPSEAVDFSMQGMPSIERLVELFRGEANLDSLRVQTLTVGSFTPSDFFCEVRIGKMHSLFDYNSILMIPDFLTRKECHELIDSADRGFANLAACQKLRLPIDKLDSGAQLLSASIVDRVLSFFEFHQPQVAARLFGRSSELKNMNVIYSPGEPAVNRYRDGGQFLPHTDKDSVTVNVLLSDVGAFDGGGTMFWPEETTDTRSSWSTADAVLLRPLPGTAFLFNGNVMHAGRKVASGIRHVYVASFSLYSKQDEGYLTNADQRIY